MTVDMKRSAQLIQWNKRVLSIGGAWPLDPSFVHFYIGYIYFVSHAALAFAHLYTVFGDMQLMIGNLLETSVIFMSSIKMILLRHSGTLRKMLQLIDESTSDKNYRDNTEKELYLAYNSIGRMWFKCLNYSTFATISIYYFGPLKDLVAAAINNETVTYLLPYKTYPFFAIQDVRIYAFMYVWQIPVCYYCYCHTAAVSLLCTLVFHVAGEISVLAYRIRRMGRKSGLSNGYDDPGTAFRDTINKHLHIVWQAWAIDDIFNFVLLEELLISTLLFGFLIFNLLSTTGALYDKLFLANYCVSLLGLILVYCITGDYFIRGSTQIQEAYYECLWYEMKTKYKKNVVSCIARAQRPLHLTAGGFYIFSLPRFSEILKTAMTYVTMLRTME